MFALACAAWLLTRPHVGTHAQADRGNPAPSAAPVAAAQPDVVLSAQSVFVACTVPAEPGDIPDGATATLEQMRSAHAGVSAYDAATTAYIHCLDSTASQFAQQYQDVASKPKLQAVTTLAVTLHNAAVEKDRALADRLNRQIRVFKARHG